MKPTIALVGRPNVGKSTLFNRLTRTRDALVHDRPGLTRDRQFGQGAMGSKGYIVVDTGGLEPAADSGVEYRMARQTLLAVDEADAVIFLVDGRAGLTPQDETIANRLRQSSALVTVAVNKGEGADPVVFVAEFHKLALGEPMRVSASHGDGVGDLIEETLRRLQEAGFDFGEDDRPPIHPQRLRAMQLRERARMLDARNKGSEPSPAKPVEARDAARGDAPPGAEPAAGDSLSDSGLEAGADAGDQAADALALRPIFAVLGRPNAGKSTLINAILGEERVIVYDQAGTTRDSIYIDFERGGKPYTLVDTAGVRRRARVSETIEKFSVIKTLQAIERCDVAVLVLDATQGVADQDANLAGYAVKQGKGIVVAVNKWDAAGGERERQEIKAGIERNLPFLDYAEFHFVSALKGKGMGGLFRALDRAARSCSIKMTTPELNRILRVAVDRQAPPLSGRARPKLRYAHQGGTNPPVVVVHGNSLAKVPDSYTRYLEQTFRSAFDLRGAPLFVQYAQQNENPYDPARGAKPKGNTLRREALSPRIAKKEEKKRRRAALSKAKEKEQKKRGKKGRG